MTTTYFEVPIAGDKLGVHAACYDDAKAIAEAIVKDGCDAEYCTNDTCEKEHYHLINCRCTDCIADNE